LLLSPNNNDNTGNASLSQPVIAFFSTSIFSDDGFMLTMITMTKRQPISVDFMLLNFTGNKQPSAEQN